MCVKLINVQTIIFNILRYLETVFRSQACINGSFLLTNDAHYGCSSKHHGVDLDRAVKLFGVISELENKTIQELVRTVYRYTEFTIN